MLIRELGVDEVALVAALRKQTRVPLIDPGEIEIDPEALRLVPRDVCARLRVLPLSVASDGADQGAADRDGRSDRHRRRSPRSSSWRSARSRSRALPLSAIEELVDKGYRQVTTAVVQPRGQPGGTDVRHTDAARSGSPEAESEVSVTAQIPLRVAAGAWRPTTSRPGSPRWSALLVAKGVVTEAELAEALREAKAEAVTRVSLTGLGAGSRALYSARSSVSHDHARS